VIESLVEKLSQGLLIPDFVVRTRESLPYDKMAEFEALGFEGWLEKSGHIQDSSSDWLWKPCIVSESIMKGKCMICRPG